ncbi:hypothetical protein IFR05_001064 [Cadophora sp. M221]|nr:hypothetical protein IFR05_001064 [Cadophora sp. M221]
MFGLKDNAEKESSPFGEEHRFLNKATVFYWAESAQASRGCVLLGGIWHTLFSATGQKPDFLLDPFFATPVFIDKNITKTIPEILRAHKNVYDQLQGAQERLRTGNPGLRFKSDPRYFRVHPLCEALITVFDEYKRVAVEKRKDGLLSAPISFDSLKLYALPLSRNEDMESLDAIRIPLLVGVSGLWLVCYSAKKKKG